MRNLRHCAIIGTVAAMLTLPVGLTLTQTTVDPDRAASGTSRPPERAPGGDAPKQKASARADRTSPDWMTTLIIIFAARAAGRSAGSGFPK